MICEAKGCGREAGPFVRCRACRAAKAAALAAWRLAHPRASARHCKAQRRRWEMAGKCTRCGDPVVDATICEPCILDNSGLKSAERAGWSCSACGQLGHTRAFRRCPARIGVDVTAYASSRPGAQGAP